MRSGKDVPNRVHLGPYSRQREDHIMSTGICREKTGVVEKPPAWGPRALEQRTICVGNVIKNQLKTHCKR